jgi:hypothetical protein
MAAHLTEIGGTAAKAAGTFREAIQDVLVLELRSLKVSMEAIRTEMQLRDERQTKALEEQGKRLTQAIESLTQEMRLRNDQLSQEMRLRDDKQSQAMQSLSEKLDFAIDIRERLGQLEGRLPRQ